MNITIRYNDETDKFSNDLNLEMRLQRYIIDNFYLAYILSNLAPIYLVGGAIRDLILAKEPKDMDFFILGTEYSNLIINILESYNIELKRNKFNGYKFIYQNTEIDLWFTEDLFSAMQYNVDGLYFDLRFNKLLSLTFEHFIKNGLQLINSENNIPGDRIKKLKKFETLYLGNRKNEVIK